MCAGVCIVLLELNYGDVLEVLWYVYDLVLGYICVSPYSSIELTFFDHLSLA